MADLLQELEQELAAAKAATRRTVGVIREIGDGVARVEGLDGIMLNEMLDFGKGITGLALNLDETEVGVVILGDYAQLHEGGEVRATGKLLQVPVGKGLLGRVVNTLGEPLDGKGPIVSSTALSGREAGARHHPAPTGRPARPDRDHGDRRDDSDRPRPARADHRRPRDGQDDHLHRHDHQPGPPEQGRGGGRRHELPPALLPSTSPSVRSSPRSRASFRCSTRPAPCRTRSWSPSPASDSATSQYLAPFAGAAMGEWFMDHGMDALIVYDDLSKHAVAYRQVSLVLKRPSGREAYPGDVFYLHSRLLERAARVGEQYGNGSLTALPIIETQAGDVSAYIPTNVISITDGQIFLETDLFYQGDPAGDLGRHFGLARRVGGAAQGDEAGGRCS